MADVVQRLLATSAQKKILVVIETEKECRLGTVKLDGDSVTVFTGYAGRPAILDVHDIEAVHIAEQHPDVVEVRRARR